MTLNNPERVGDWMQTFTGKAFYPLDPKPEDVCIEDIAHSLSLTCRYAGHVNRFYSVAEHCVLLSTAVKSENALWGLLHDAAEAYVGDMVRPLKQNIPIYKLVENNIMATIGKALGLKGDEPAEIMLADSRILKDERSVLLNRSPLPWADYIEGLQPLGVKVTGWDSRVAEQRFLSRFRSLTRDAAL